MNVLVLGLYAEGRTDERFLPLVIQRTAELILTQYDRPNIEALEPIILTRHPATNRSESILQAAREAFDYHAVIVHADADNRTHKQTLHELFNPGYILVQQEKEPVCRTLVPIIPIRMVEAWMLADSEALRRVLRTKASIQMLSLSGKVKQVELDKDPKETIKQVIQKAYPDQPQQWNRIRGELYTDLAPVIRLDLLNQLTAYRQFVNDLTDALKKLNFIL